MSRPMLLGFAAYLLAGAAWGGSGAGTGPEAAEAERTPFLGGFLKETRIVYPLRVGPWEAKDEHRYDTPAAGVSVRYADGAHDDRWIDVYFYPVGVLTAEDIAKVAAQERESLRKAWLTEPGSEDDITPLHAVDIAAAPSSLASAVLGAPVPPDEQEPPRKAYSVDLAWEKDGVRRSSAMVVLFDRLYMVKSRFSVKQEAVPRADVRRLLERFTIDLDAALAISSSGACWQPLRIEPLDPGAPVPEGGLFTVESNGEVTERVYPDRVLARDPGSDMARFAMLLGMSMQDRLYGGCDSAEPSNPEVPEGSREIRIEYPAPDSDSGPGRSARSARSGVG